MDNVEVETIKLLRLIKIYPSLMGYYYLKRAVSLILSKNAYKMGMTKLLYPIIAKEFSVPWQRVERNIRHAIESADKEALIRVFDNSNFTNLAFILSMAEEVRLRINA